MLEDQPRKLLGFFPTPITPLPRLSEYLKGPSIFIKRDDQTGVAFGGNKVRKLEYLIGTALSERADTLVSGGAAQSNHCRQTAAAAAMVGLDCHLALGGEAPEFFDGNLLIDQLCKSTIHWCGKQRKGETIPDICRSLIERGKKPFIIPYGGSNAVGAVGFVTAMSELKQQAEEAMQNFSHIVFASSSGGTHAGMLVGRQIHQVDSQLLGIGIDKEDMNGVSLGQYIVELANETKQLLGREDEHRITEQDVTLSMDYVGDGYGVVGEPEREAINLMASLEGILLDPVYTARAMGGMIDHIRKKKLRPADTVLFWHTGGAPALFAYSKILKGGGY